MATISKFYLLDATSPNTGTMPSGAFITTNVGAGTPATGARTARDATDVHGAANPDTKSVVTAAAVTTNQVLEHRRFVSRPLAAQTISLAQGNWTFSYARQLSNTNHTGGATRPMILLDIYGWTPSTGFIVGSPPGNSAFPTTSPTVAATEQAESVVQTWASAALSLSDGDILVFEIRSDFTQGMAVAYTDSFSYNGTTDGNTTTCASFVAPPAPLTLFSATAPGIPDVGMALTVT